MKVTAILPDELITQVRYYSRGKNITDSITIALEEWLALQKIKTLNCEVHEKPLEFNGDFSASKIREINRE